jgi:3-ketosteroid 9alpha-monooxygenase subunit B
VSSSDPDNIQLIAELDGVTHTVPMLPGQTVVEALEAAGQHPPYSCRAGACAACMCHLLDGKVEMMNNNVLEDEELADGWILSCQATAQTPVVRVKYPT